MEKVTVVEAPQRKTSDSENLVSLGMGTLSSFLVKNGIDIRQVNMNLEYGIERRYRSRDIDVNSLKDPVKNREYISGNSDYMDTEYRKVVKNIIKPGKSDAVFISVMATFHLIFALGIAKSIKRLYPEKTVVLGGAFTKKEDSLYAVRYPFIDYIHNGSLDKVYIGKETEPSSLKEKDGFCYYEDGEFKIKDRAEEDLENRPPPYFTKTTVEKSLKLSTKGRSFTIPYQLGTRCPYNCAFCPYDSQSFNYKSPEKIKKEMEWMKNRYNSNRFYLVDNNIMNNPSKLLEISEEINDLKVEWGGFSNYIDADTSFFKDISEAGCRFLIHGMESWSEKIIRKMGKPYIRENAISNINDQKKHGIKNLNNLMTGFPGETEEDFKQTYDFIRKNFSKIRSAFVSYFMLLKGTPIYENPERFNIEINPADRKKLEKDMRFLNDKSIFIDRLLGNIPIRYSEGEKDWKKVQKTKMRRYRKLKRMHYAFEARNLIFRHSELIPSYILRRPYISFINTKDALF